jgi:hypothetical protein
MDTFFETEGFGKPVLDEVHIVWDQKVHGNTAAGSQGK